MKKLAMTILLLTVVLCSAFSIGFGYHVIEAKSDADFARGIFPIAVNYQFNFPVPDLLGGSATEFAFRLDNGLDFRTLRQNPETGDFYAMGEPVKHTLDYMVIYDEFKLFFNQGFWADHFTIGASIDGRFENAYESLDYLTWPDGDALFSDNEGKARFSSFTGAPELAGDRSVFQTSLSALAEIDFMKDEEVRRSGMRLTSSFRITGPWMPMNDGSAAYMLSDNRLDIAFTPYHLERKSGLGWLSFVIDNSTGYRFIVGEKVPYHIEGGDLYEDVAAPATEHVLTNRLSLTLYGPQVSEDTYPSASLFWAFGYSFGPALNSTGNVDYSETVSVLGVTAEVNILDIFRLYWEWGYVLDPVFNEAKKAICRFGFTFGV